MIIRAILTGVFLATPAIAQSAEYIRPRRSRAVGRSRRADVFARWPAIAYSVKTTNAEADKQQTDLWRVNWDGSQRRP